MATVATTAMVEGNGCNEGNGVVDDRSISRCKIKGSGYGCGEGSGIGNDGTEGNVGGTCRARPMVVALLQWEQ